MDRNLNSVIEKRIERTIENLKKNNFEARYAKTKEDALEIVKEYLKDGDTISNGGSVSVAECGVYDYIKAHNFNYLDRLTAKTSEETEAIYCAAFSCDVYFCSSNAVTENGELYNVDGNSNRIACISYGPKSVVMIVGVNKIVRDIGEAVKRVKSVAAPANCERLGCQTYCKAEGECVSLSKGGDICSGCSSDARICCNYLISSKQRHKNRIKVIIVGEELGY